MYKLWKYYNQNRLKVWTIILAIVLGLAMIHTLNKKIGNSKLQQNNNTEETTSDVVSSHNENKSMVTGNSVSKTYSGEFNEFINRFFNSCIQHKPEEAYEMVADDTKQELYPTEALFEKNYYENKFTGNKQFSFQSWSSANGLYVYQVKIFDNMLETGKTSDNAIEEYVTITTEGGTYKMNLNSYLGKTLINKKTEDEKMSVQVTKVDRYLDYEIYTLDIKNKENKNILLDAKRKNKTCYLLDRLNNKFEAILYESNDENLEFKAKEMKTIKIKFNVANREGLVIKSINFSDIVDKDEYENNSNIEGSSFKADV